MRGRSAGLVIMMTTTAASAQPVRDGIRATLESVEPASPVPQVIGYGALPGGISVPDADTIPAGSLEVTALGGFGYRKGLLAKNHRFERSLGDLGFAYAPRDGLVFALALDGRYDRHFGLPPAGDHGYVGDPHVLARFAKRVGANRFGIQLGIWVPGKNAPSIAASAISIDGRGLATFEAGPARLSLEAGFRLDNSAKSIDDVTKLSEQDRVSLGVSDYNAVVAGVHVTLPAGKAFVAGELSTDVFFGSKAPRGALVELKAPGPIVRGAVTLGYHFSDSVSLLAYLELAKVSSIDPADIMAGNIPQIPYEPAITSGVGFAARFGGQHRSAHVETFPLDHDCVKTNRCKPIEIIAYAEISGTITDTSGNPIVGGKVTVKLNGGTSSAVTDDKGAYTVTKLKIGKTIGGTKQLDDVGGEIEVAADGKKPGRITLSVVEGANTAPPIELDPELPPAQLRGTVRGAASGKPIVGGTIAVEPGGATATSDAQGRFTIDLSPGTYKATAAASGFVAQTLDVIIELDPNGVAVIKNFELRRKP
jgi:hypothetical protein